MRKKTIKMTNTSSLSSYFVIYIWSMKMAFENLRREIQYFYSMSKMSILVVQLLDNCQESKF